MVKMIEGLSEIIDHYNGFIIDVWGVLTDGVNPFPLAIKALNKIKENNKTILLLTNSPRRTEDVVLKLEERGINRELYDYVLSSGELTYRFINYLSKERTIKIYHIG